MSAALTSTRTIRLILAEDHVVTRMGLRTLLQSREHLEVVGETGTVAETIMAVEDLRPDLVLLDVRLADGLGFEVCRHIRGRNLETRTLMLTSFADDETIFNSIAAGADGYLLKEIDGDALVSAIKSVAEGKSILDPAVTRRVLARMRDGAPARETDGKLALLSPQERRVLALVAEGKTNKEIGAVMTLSDKTVKNYLANALEKLQMNRRSQAAAFFVRNVPPAP
jgi:DNA-binding NarL/FixJ family response regulator